MYQILDEGILNSENGVAYVFKLKPENTNFNEHKFTSTFRKIIEEVNLPGEIIIIPKQYDFNKEIIERYTKIINKYCKRDELLDSVRKQLIRETYIEQTKTYKFEYDFYIVFTNNQKSFKKKKLNKFSKSKIKDLSQNEIKYHQKKAKIIKEQIIKYSEIKKMELGELNKVLKHLYLPSQFSYENNFVMNIENNYIHYDYETDSGEQKKKFVNYIQVSDLPQETKEPFGFFDEIRKLKYPVDIVVKFHLVDDFKLEQKLHQKYHTLNSEQTKYRRENKVSSSELDKKIKFAYKGAKKAEISEELLIQFQINFRLSSEENVLFNGEEISGQKMLEKKYIELKKILKRDRITTNVVFGNQEELANNFLIANMVNGDNIHLTEINYLDNFNMISIDKLGDIADENALLLLESYPGRKPIFINSFSTIEGKSSETAPTRGYFGKSGGGKSQLSNNEILMNLIVKDTNSLIIDPKGDRKGFAKKLKLNGLDGTKFIDEIVIDDGTNYRGSFDFFKNYKNAILSGDDKNEKETLKISVASFLKLLLKIEEKAILFDNYKITKYIEEFLEQKLIDELSMISFVKFLEEKDKEYYQILDSYKDYPYANLFFGDGTEEELKLEKKLTIIILDQLKKTNQKYNIKNQLFNFVFEHLTGFIKNFYRTQNGKAFDIVLEELHYLKEQTGTNLDDELSRLVRSFGGSLTLITQSINDPAPEVLDQISAFYIGSNMSVNELESVSEKLSISRTELEAFNLISKSSTSIEDKYVFFAKDTNGYKGLVRQRILPMFTKAFETTRSERA